MWGVLVHFNLCYQVRYVDYIINTKMNTEKPNLHLICILNLLIDFFVQFFIPIKDYYVAYQIDRSLNIISKNFCLD
jgi:uncharacterized membrane protein